MAKKRKSAARDGKAAERSRALPQELAARLGAVWQAVGHLIDWCDDSAAWTQLFSSEARPYRETFYWESIARMLSEFLAKHPTAAPEEALSDCLIATQCSPGSDDSPTLHEFHRMWDSLLRQSRTEIEAVVQSDLELARQYGNYETVATLYAADRQTWERE